MLSSLIVAIGMMSTDTLQVPRIAAAPALDGIVSPAEYGAATPVVIATPTGEVRAFVVRHGDDLFIGATLPDSGYYWGDDLVVSLDARGLGGAEPADGDRQWYMRRTLDSSTVNVALGGRWYAPGRMPTSIGAARSGDGWQVASASRDDGWSIELRIRVPVTPAGSPLPRLALRTYNDRPSGWWSWPLPPAGVPASRVERSPAMWGVLLLRRDD